MFKAPPPPRYGPPIAVEKNREKVTVRLAASGFKNNPPAQRLLLIGAPAAAVALALPILVLQEVFQTGWSLGDICPLLGAGFWAAAWGCLAFILVRTGFIVARCSTVIVFADEELTIEKDYPRHWVGKVDFAEFTGATPGCLLHEKLVQDLQVQLRGHRAYKIGCGRSDLELKWLADRIREFFQEQEKA